MLILDLWGISFHADSRPMGISFHPVVVLGLGNDLLLKSILGHCEKLTLCSVPNTRMTEEKREVLQTWLNR